MKTETIERQELQFDDHDNMLKDMYEVSVIIIPTEAQKKEGVREVQSIIGNINKEEVKRVFRAT